MHNILNMAGVWERCELVDRRSGGQFMVTWSYLFRMFCRQGLSICEPGRRNCDDQNVCRGHSVSRSSFLPVTIWVVSYHDWQLQNLQNRLGQSDDKACIVELAAVLG